MDAPASTPFLYQQLARKSVACTDTTRIIIFPLNGPGRVWVNQIDLGSSTSTSPLSPDYLEIRDVTVKGGVNIYGNGSFNIIRNVNAADFHVQQTQGAGQPTGNQILGGVFGPCKTPCGQNIFGGTNTLLGGAVVHDFTAGAVGDHTDAVFVRGSIGGTIRNSVFYGNEFDNIREQNCCVGSSEPTNANLTIENNWFGPDYEIDHVTERRDSVNIDSPISFGLIRNNSFLHGGPVFGCNGQPCGQVTLVNNLILNRTCKAGVTYSHNLYVQNTAADGGTACGPSDVKLASWAAFGYASGATDATINLRAPSPSPAVGFGTTANCAPDRIDGTARTLGICDAGAG